MTQIQKFAFLTKYRFMCVYLLILRLGRLALLVRFSAKSAISMAIVIIPNLFKLFNDNLTFFEKICHKGANARRIWPQRAQRLSSTRI